MSLLTVGSVAFDAIETPFGKTDKIIGGAGTYIALAASFYNKDQKIVAVVGDDFPQEMIDQLSSRGVDVEGFAPLVVIPAVFLATVLHRAV